jgi:large subunit ribosomal protein L15
MRSILVSPATAAEHPIEDPFGREPFQHPALANIDKLNIRQPQDIAQKEKLAKLAIDIGLPEVIRWKPRLVCVLSSPYSEHKERCTTNKRPLPA